MSWLLPWGPATSTVRRSSVRSAPMPVSLSIAFTGRSRKRFDAPAASAISLRPMAVSWSTFLPNSGLLASRAASSSTNCATRFSSSVVSSVLSGTSPAASAGAMGFSASGGSSLSLVAVLVSVVGSVAISFLRRAVAGARQVNSCPFRASGFISCIIGAKTPASSGAAVLLRQVGFRNASECNEFSVSR